MNDSIGRLWGTRFWLWLCVIALAAPAAVSAADLRSSVSQYGITFVFDKPYATGQFANGDWWVAGPITLVDITPRSTSTQHGWTVNPADKGNQPFDSRIRHHDRSLEPALPHTVGSGSSIVKSISAVEGRHAFLQTAVVLTVLGSVPPDDGATVFRPPYFGAGPKTLHSIHRLRTELLPRLTSPGNARSLGWVENRFQRVQLDHKAGWTGRALHPVDNMPNYGADIARDTADGALALMLDDPVEAKMPALIRYVQHGIDIDGMRQHGIVWPGDGGHGNGRKLPWIFAAVLLGDSGMKSRISASPSGTFSEDSQVWYSAKADGGRGKVLFGKECSETLYWRWLIRGSGAPKDCRDPYGYIDSPPDYQFCCTGKVFKAASLAIRAMPDIRALWNNDHFLEYVDRWVSHGIWASPDPCAKAQPSSLTGTCVPGGGRNPEDHGKLANGGHYTSSFAESFWAAYRDVADSIAAGGDPNPGGAAAAPSAPVIVDVVTN